MQGYTLTAAATGAIPVPAASVAIAAEPAAMFGHLASALGTPITWGAVAESMGLTATLNIVGRKVFIEGAKLLAWGAGGLLAAAALSGLGATTARVQTYILGLLAIEIGKNAGAAITSNTAALVIKRGKATYEVFVAEARRRGLAEPT